MKDLRLERKKKWLNFTVFKVHIIIYLTTRVHMLNWDICSILELGDLLFPLHISQAGQISQDAEAMWAAANHSNRWLQMLLCPLFFFFPILHHQTTLRTSSSYSSTVAGNLSIRGLYLSIIAYYQAYSSPFIWLSSILETRPVAYWPSPFE